MDKLPVVLAFVEDLFFVSRIESAIKMLGYKFIFMERSDSLDRGFLDYLSEQKPDLLIFDLNNKNIPWEDWIREAKNDSMSSHYPLIAFGSHMDVETMQAAQKSGADAVFAKSRFTEAMPELIEKYVLKV